MPSLVPRVCRRYVRRALDAYRRTFVNKSFWKPSVRAAVVALVGGLGCTIIVARPTWLAAQSSRMQGPTTLAITPPVPALDRQSGACAAAIDFAVEGGPGVEWLGASGDPQSDSVDAQLIGPGVGMVAVDRHGRVISSGEASNARERAQAPCCLPPTSASANPAPTGRADYTASRGSDRAVCDEPMKPPPSTRSPL